MVDGEGSSLAIKTNVRRYDARRTDLTAEYSDYSTDRRNHHGVEKFPESRLARERISSPACDRILEISITPSYIECLLCAPSSSSSTHAQFYSHSHTCTLFIFTHISLSHTDTNFRHTFTRHFILTQTHTHTSFTHLHITLHSHTHTHTVSCIQRQLRYVTYTARLNSAPHPN